MKPIERVFTTLKFEEPDKVPLFLFFTVHGAKELNLSFPEYYRSGENIAKAQLVLQQKYNHDCLHPFFYAAIEYKAFGGTPNFKKYGPPESGKPIFSNVEELLSKKLPDSNNEAFKEVVKAQKILYEKKGDEIPIINSVIAPLSLPIMLFGFEKWIDCISYQPEEAKEVVEHLIDYTIELANSLIENGATAIGYFNPLASPRMLRKEEFEKISLNTCKKYFKSIKGPSVYAVAGAKSEKLIPTIIEDIKAPGIMLSAEDDLKKIKQQFGKKINLMGNLNNIEMIGWNEKKTEIEIKRCIDEAGEGGGYIITDQHGDLPLSVEHETLVNIVKARNRFGYYNGK